MSLQKFLFTLAISCVLSHSVAFAQENVVDLGAKISFSRGEEFPPGGRGRAEANEVDGKEAITIEYNFEEGGSYVAAYMAAHIDEGTSELRFMAKSEEPCRFIVRLKDSTGQTHQFPLGYNETGEWQTFRIDLGDHSKKTPLSFGGHNDRIIHYPISTLGLGVNSGGAAPTGSISFASFSVER